MYVILWQPEENNVNLLGMQVKRASKCFGQTTFTVTVFPGTDYVFIFVLIIIKEIVRLKRQAALANNSPV